MVHMKIVSTMGAGSIGHELDLATLTDELRSQIGEEVEVNFHSSGMVTVRLTEDDPAYTIYRTGSFQVRGAESEEELEKASERLLDKLREIGVNTQDAEFRHVTSVFMEDLDQEVNLEAVAIGLGLENTEYEPEQFPGLIYRPPHSEVTMLVFASGKIIISGTTEKNHATMALQTLIEELSFIQNT